MGWGGWVVVVVGWWCGGWVGCGGWWCVCGWGGGWKGGGGSLAPGQGRPPFPTALPDTPSHTHAGLAIYSCAAAHPGGGGSPGGAAASGLLRRLPCPHNFIYDALVAPNGDLVVAVGQDKRISFMRWVGQSRGGWYCRSREGAAQFMFDDVLVAVGQDKRISFSRWVGYVNPLWEATAWL